MKDGNGTLVLTGKSTYTGGTTIKMGRSLWEAHPPWGQGLSPSMARLISVVRAIPLSSGLMTYANSHITSSSGTSSLIINNSAANILDGDVREDGGVVFPGQIRVGSLNLTGNNTYTGGTTLNAGTLNIGHASALGSGRSPSAASRPSINVSGSALSLAGISKQIWNADFTFKGTNSLNLGTGPSA